MLGRQLCLTRKSVSQQTIFRFLLSVGCAICLPIIASQAQEVSTWQTIQNHILSTNCSGCHQSGTGFAGQSGLELTPDVAYQQLVGTAPTNLAARQDGLLRVSQEGGDIGVLQSFLWEKINAPNQEHFYADHPDYGALMPLGAEPLTNGELAFIQSWIQNGAPEIGSVADLGLLDDTSRFSENHFEPLTPPEQGIQLHLGPFDVWPAERYDREFYYYQPYKTGQDTFITGYEIAYREGSHHFILYHYPDDESAPPEGEYRDLRNENGIAALDPSDASKHSAWVVGTQTPYTHESLPDGVALRLPAGSGFDLNVHSVNRTGESRPGEIYVNLFTATSDEIKHVAEQDNFANYDINLPPHAVTTLTKEFTFSETRNVISLWSHAHEHMTEFRVEYVGGERDGELIYWANDWEHPPILSFDSPLVFDRGDKIRLVTTYDNQTDKTISYGPLSSDEMQFLFYISYPLRGDFDKNGTVSVRDIDLLTKAILRGSQDPRYDLNYDGIVDASDRTTWVDQVTETFFGDSNLDGQFNSDDLVAVFDAGKFENGANAGWEEGDWNGDGYFTSSDFVMAFQDGGYEKGPRVATRAVPEPTCGLVMLLVFTCALSRRKGLA
ncbi:MAG: hypothetical protein KDB27_02180 [Planctomycetales bacterium]|nr:hypothetical protein [Planctomycetales bacterium]